MCKLAAFLQHFHFGKVNISREQVLVPNCVPTGKNLKQLSESGVPVLHCETIEMNSGPFSLLRLETFLVTSDISEHIMQMLGWEHAGRTAQDEQRLLL